MRCLVGSFKRRSERIKDCGRVCIGRWVLRGGREFDYSLGLA